MKKRVKRILSWIAGALITIGGLLLIVGGATHGFSALSAYAESDKDVNATVFYGVLGLVNVLYGIFIIFRRRLKRKKA